MITINSKSLRSISSVAMAAALVSSGAASAETISTVTQFNYDVAGRLRCAAVRMNPPSYFVQDDACAQSDANSPTPDRITYNAYDAAGQLIQVRRGIGSNLDQAYATYSYTSNGKVEYTIDANGNRAKMEYDGFDRQSKWIFPATARPTAFVPGSQAQVLASAGSVNTADYEEYTYDANGNRTTLRKRDGLVITYQYDALNRMTAKWMPENSPIPGTYRRHTYYFYDLRGLMTGAKFDHPDGTGEGVGTVYDGFGRITSTTLAMTGTNRTLSYQYDANGNRLKVTHPDGVYFRSSYDGNGRLASYWWTSPGGNEVAFGGVTYVASGQRASITRGSSSTTYDYGQDQLLAGLSQNFNNGVGNDVQTYVNNSAGQVVEETRSNSAFAFSARYNVSRNYNSNGLNQYASSASTTSAGTTSNTFCHDVNGNLTADGVYVYLYDVENRLVEKRQKAITNCAAIAYDGPVAAQLRYDPMGRLFETIGSATGTTHMLYDGDKLAAEYDGTGALLRRYFWGDRTDEPVLYSEGANLDCASNRTQFLSTDRQGSIVASADCYGNFIRAWRYDEYGIPQSSDGSALRPSNGARFLYTGQAFIPDAGLYHYKARMYSPSLGRFLQTDPIGYKDQLNLYAYVANDPVNGRDPDGKCRNRDDAGECVVQNRAGEAGADAAGKLQQQVRTVDHAIRGLDAKAKVTVSVGNGKTREMAGSQLQKAWSRTSWSVVPDGTKMGNPFGAQMKNGAFSGTPSYLEGFRKSASDWGRDPGEATRSVVLHDFGHSTPPGGEIIRNFGSDFDGRERATSRLGRDIGNEIGVSFECRTFGLGC